MYRTNLCTAVHIGILSYRVFQLYISITNSDAMKSLVLLFCLYFYIVSAMADDDYTPISSFSLEFPVGTNANATQCVNISILDNEMFEETETFTVELAVMPHPRVMEGNAETIINIVDNDSK